MNDPSSLRDQALVLVAAGDLPQAIALLERRLAESPDDADVRVDLGLALSANGDAAGAERRLAEAVAIDPDHVPARRALAAALDAQEKLDAAVFHLLRAAKAAPDDATLQRDLGTAFYRKGLHDKALATYERARAADPNDPRTWFALGLVHDAKKAPAEAIAALREAVRLDPKFVAARATLADALAALGEHEVALAELSALLQVDRTNEAAARNREVLELALQEMKRERLLGRSVASLRASTLVQEGRFKDFGLAGDRVALGTPYAELYAGVGALPEREVSWLFLTLLDPVKASKQSGRKLGVQIVDAAAGRPRDADLATALGVTFLREGLGVSMTTAAKLWTRAATEEAGFAYGGVRIEAVTLPRPTHPGTNVHGLRLRLP